MLPFLLSLQREAVDAAFRTALLPDRARRAARVESEPTPYETVYTENVVGLRYYESPAEPRQDVPVVFVYAFINTPAILDLDADRSVVGQFLERGFDVYVVDWGEPSTLDVHLSLDDYVGRYLDNCVDIAREHSAADAVYLVGFSTGSPTSAAYAALFPEKVAALGMQGPPLDFDVEGGMFDFREMAENTDPQRLVDVVGNVPAPLVDAGFSIRKPVVYTVDYPLRLWEHVDDAEYIERAARIARWTFDGPDLAGATYRQFVEDLLVENELIQSRLVIDGERVDLGDVTMPVALVLGRDDEFVPHASSLPFLDVVPSSDTEVFEFPTGHVGTLVGRAAHEQGWPRVCDWFARRS